MKGKPVNLQASVAARLRNIARGKGINFEFVLRRYAIERLLYRLSLSPYRDRFVLKGAMLSTAWIEDPFRPTRDVDLLGFGDSDPPTVEWTRHLAYVQEKWGNLRVTSTEPRHVLALRDAFADIPPADPKKRTKPLEEYENRAAAANNLLRALSSMMTWSAPRGWISANPCIGVKKLKGGKPYEPWSWEAICLFEKEARAALWHGAALALYTGQRYGDVIKMRWSDIREGQIQVEQEKTEKKLWIPLHKALKRVLKVVPRTSEFILTSGRGEAWTEDGFHTAWQREMKEAKFEPLRRQKCVFHGLRKSAVVMLLEAGCTDAEVSAITGQSREMLEHYALQVNQKKLAAAAILKWEALHRRERARERRSGRRGVSTELLPA